MKGKTVAYLFSALVIAAVGALYFVAPMLETAQEKVDRHVEREAERARRLLLQFDTAQQQITYALEDLKQRQIDLDLTAKDIQEILEKDSKVGENINKELEELVGSAPYRKNWASVLGGSPAQASIGLNSDKQQQELTAAMAKAQQAASANRKLLDQADRVISEAMRFQIGTVAGTIHPEVNRVAGMIRLRQADDRFQQALWVRNSVETKVRLVLKILNHAHEVQGRLPLFETASLDEQITKIQGWIADLQTQRDRYAGQAARFEDTVTETKKKIHEARVRAEAARIKLDQIVEEGYRITDPKSFETFTKSYERQAALNRAATAEADATEFGRLKNIRADETGDLLRRTYLPKEGQAIKVAFGMAGLENRLQAAAFQTNAREQAIQILKGEIETLEGVKQDLAAGKQATEQTLEVVIGELKKNTEVLQKRLADAAGIEEDALAFGEQAAANFSTASTQAALRNRTQRWVAGELQAERGDALFLTASILVQRIKQLRQVTLLFRQLEQMGVSEVNARDVDVQLTNATKKTLETLQSAWEQYQSAYGKLDTHFSVVGNLANVQLAFAQAVGPDHPNYSTYRDNAAKLLNVIADKEKHPQVAGFINAMAALKIEQRKPAPAPGEAAPPEPDTTSKPAPPATQETTKEGTSDQGVDDTEKPAPTNREVIGRWVDESPLTGSRITIFVEDGKLYVEQQFKDGRNLKEELVEKKSPFGRRFDNVEGSATGDNLVLDNNGNLQIRNNGGLIATAIKIE